MLLTDKDIKALVARNPKAIEPFVPHKVEAQYSYGLEPMGYTLRLTATTFAAVDGSVVIPPQSVFLFETLETIEVPDNCTVFMRLKSSYARQGIILNCTPFDAGWKGRPTITIINPLLVYRELKHLEGICQMMFHLGTGVPETLYSGRYQGDMNASGCKLPESNS